MYCSGCGHALVPGQPVCPQCGRPAAAPVPPIPNLDFQLQNYSGRIRALAICWFVYGGLSLLTGIGGLFFASHMFNGFGPWSHSPWGNNPWFFGPGFLHLALGFVIVRCALAFIAGWGLMEHAPWGRVVAIVAGFLVLIRIPLGTALGIWTLVTLLGYRNSTLYEQL
jgi:hypothetical protein